MPRPRKQRTICYAPATLVYKPVGKPLPELPQIQLSLEELETLRLADLEGLPQAESGAQMAVSRSTFQRTLTAARYKVAKALVEGAALVVGEPEAQIQRWRCSHCGQEWAIIHGAGGGTEPVCPHCGHAVDEA